MRLEAAVLGGLFIIGGLCNPSPDVDGYLHRRHAEIHEQIRREADAAVHQHEKRTLSTADVFGQPGGLWPTMTVPSGYTLAAGVELTPVPGMSTPTLALAATATAAPLLANGSIDTTQWNTEASTACMNAINMLNGNASNPTGLVACYNIPYLDQANGTFEAELRIYNISMPTGQWVGMTASEMMVALNFQDATIQASNNLVPVKRNMDSQPLLKRQMTATSSMMATATSSGTMMTPSQVAVRIYVGQIYQNLLMPGMNITEIQPLLMPSIFVEATNPSGMMLNTSLSSMQASFVAGVFSTQTAIMTDPKTILGKPAVELAAAQAGSPTPFVVPGLSLGVEPVGLIVTGIWTLIFTVAVGLGTLGRIQFREQYRRQLKDQRDEGVQRF